MVAAIQLEHVYKNFRQGWKQRKIEALKDLSLEVEAGEAYGFIGKNGAGKSTTIKILTGAIRHDGGKASLFGVPVSDHGSRKGLGYVPENPWLYDYLSPLEIVEMGVLAHGHKAGKDSRAQSLKWIERFDLGAVSNRRVRGFSKGMLQRTALAHALACTPRLLILDEPLSGLDPLGRKDVVDILLEYRKTGGTLFFSSHVLHDVERLADRFGLIHDGVLKSVQTPTEMIGSAEQVLIRSLGASFVQGMQKDVGDRWFVETSRDALWLQLERLREAGHEIIEVKPAMSLERLFLDVIAL